MKPRPMNNARRALLRTCYLCLTPSENRIYFQHADWCPKAHTMERIPPELMRDHYEDDDNSRRG